MQVRNVVDEIEYTVGSNVFGPIEAKLHAIATQLDLRKPTESGAAGGADVGLARINVVGGAVVAITGRILSVVVTQEDLIVVGVSGAELVHPRGSWRKGPTAAKDLGAGVLFGQPLRGDLHSGVVDKNSAAGADEVGSVERVLGVQVVINLGDAGMNGVGRVQFGKECCRASGSTACGREEPGEVSQRSTGGAKPGELCAERSEPGSSICRERSEAGADQAVPRIECTRTSGDGDEMGRGVAIGVLLLLVIGKVKELVLLYWAADAGAELLEIQRGLIAGSEW